MDKKRCATCKYWEREVGCCRRASSEDGRAEDKDTMMAAYDYEGYSAWLETLPDFYCAMWEKREEADSES